jgi:hypothetical protein
MLPEKWFLPWLTDEHFELSKEWVLKTYPKWPSYRSFENTYKRAESCWNSDGEYDISTDHVRHEYKEITLEEFKMYVLKESNSNFLIFN